MAVPAEAAPLDGGPSPASDPSAVPGASFRSAGGRELKVLCGFEHIVNVQDCSEVGIRVTPTVIDTDKGRIMRGRVRARLDPVDFWEIDRAVMEAARPLLDNPQRPTIVPLSFHSLSRTRAREKLFEAVEREPDHIFPGMITEIVGMDAGTPQGRLADTVPVVRAFCSAVFVESLTPAMLSSVVIKGVAGFSFDLREMRRGEKALLDGLQAYGEVGRDLVRTVMARGLPSSDYLEAAAAAGVTHTSLRGDSGAAPAPAPRAGL